MAEPARSDANTPLIDKLVAAYVAAAQAESRLERARRLFVATHTGPALESLRKAAQNAEEQELAFQEAWRQAQEKLQNKLGRPPP